MLQLVKEETSEYNYFVEMITSMVVQKLGKEYTAQVYKVTKNNSIELDSLVLVKQGEDYAPNIYLQPYYDAYRKGIEISELADRLCGVYQSDTYIFAGNKIDFFFDNVKPYIIYRLVNYERNKKLLEKLPYKKYLDLAIIYHCLVRDDGEGIGTIRITKEHLKHWNITPEQLYETAENNTPRLFPYSIKSMEEVMEGFLFEECPDAMQQTEKRDTISRHPMYILSNHIGINGAACLLYQDILMKISEQFQSDYFIFPSSIHEVILVPVSDISNHRKYAAMVKDINETQVAKEEVLSDNVYYYSQKTGLKLPN